MEQDYKITIETSSFDLKTFSNIVIDENGTILDASNADILFIPYDKWRDKKGPLLSKDIFPLLQFIKERHSELTADVLIGLEDYAELGLHGSFKDFGKVFIKRSKPFAFGIALNIIANYAYDAMKNSDKPEARITIGTQINNSTVNIYYSGSPDKMTEKITTVVDKLEKTDKKNWVEIFKEYSKKDENPACNTTDN